VASRWFLGSSIIGATSMAQLKEDIAAAHSTLDADTLKDNQSIQLRYPNPAGSGRVGAGRRRFRR
jgi:aryl-alcohol dehydrogenase-like predicted oxidoreductase